MTVRSSVLAHVTTTSGTGFNAYTCPTGWRTIVKNVTFDNSTLTASTAFVYIVSSVGGQVGYLLNQPINASSLGSWSGWVVMNPGDTITVAAGEAGIRFWISGTLLKLTGLEPL